MNYFVKISIFLILSHFSWKYVTLALFAWTYQPGLSVMVQCFSLTINQQTILFSLAFQPNEHGLCFSYVLHVLVCYLFTHLIWYVSFWTCLLFLLYTCKLIRSSIKILISDAYILGAKSIYPKSEVCSQGKGKKYWCIWIFALFAWTYRLGLSGMIQYFSLTTK